MFIPYCPAASALFGTYFSLPCFLYIHSVLHKLHYSGQSHGGSRSWEQGVRIRPTWNANSNTRHISHTHSHMGTVYCSQSIDLFMFLGGGRKPTQTNRVRICETRAVQAVTQTQDGTQDPCCDTVPPFSFSCTTYLEANAQTDCIYRKVSASFHIISKQDKNAVTLKLVHRYQTQPYHYQPGYTKRS